MRRILLVCLLVCACVKPVVAQDAPTAQTPGAERIRDLDSVVVRGVQPGPGLWKVSKDDHVLWILGTLSPLPKNITWDSRHAEALIARSQEVLAGTDIQLTAKLGFFNTLGLLPSLIGLRNNPDGAMLKDVVPPDLYARWSVLKKKYIGTSGKVEKWRPVFAALDLYDEAIDKAGLTDKLLVQKTADAAAKRAGVKITTPKVTIVVDDPKAAVKEFKKIALDDTECFRKTLDRIDTDLGTMTARANAWATGDIDALRGLPYSNQRVVCAEVISETQLARKRGGGDLAARSEQAWLDAADSALKSNSVTFATLPIGNLLRDDGYLSRLRALGYAVEEPASKSQADAGTKSSDNAMK